MDRACSQIVIILVIDQIRKAPRVGLVRGLLRLARGLPFVEAVGVAEAVGDELGRDGRGQQHRRTSPDCIGIDWRTLSASWAFATLRPFSNSFTGKAQS